MSNKSWKSKYAQTHGGTYPQPKPNNEANKIVNYGRKITPDNNYELIAFLGMIVGDSDDYIEVYRAKNIQTQKTQYILVGFTDKPEDRITSKIELNKEQHHVNDTFYYTEGTIGVLHTFDVPNMETLVTIIDTKILLCLNDQSKSVEERIQAIKDAYIGVAKTLQSQSITS